MTQMHMCWDQAVITDEDIHVLGPSTNNSRRHVCWDQAVTTEEDIRAGTNKQ